MKSNDVLLKKLSYQNRYVNQYRQIKNHMDTPIDQKS